MDRIPHTTHIVKEDWKLRQVECVRKLRADVEAAPLESFRELV